MTTQTGVEFAMFTKKGERMIIRGNSSSVNITLEKEREMAAQGWKWSGHTHPVTELNSIVPSKGDLNILKQFPQKHSVIYNSKGEFYIFEKR